jgi:hypothetical protein
LDQAPFSSNGESPEANLSELISEEAYITNRKVISGVYGRKGVLVRMSESSIASLMELVGLKKKAMSGIGIKDASYS